MAANPRGANGPRQRPVHGRNRNSVRNIASKSRKRTTGVPRRTPTQAVAPRAFDIPSDIPKPTIPVQTTPKIKKLAQSQNQQLQLPAAFSATMQGAQAQAEASTARANMTALALAAARRQQHSQGDTGGGQSYVGIKGYARQQAREVFGKGYWGPLNKLVSGESGWNPDASNPSSSAAGLFQFLDSTRENYGLSASAGPKKQINAGLQYIQDRYGDPRRAWKFWQATVNENATLAPRNLQDLARQWISSGYKGY